MGRLSDMTLIGLVLTALLFFGAVILLHQIVTLNPVNPFSVYVVILSTVLGLRFGIITGWFFTKDQLKILRMKGIYKPAHSRVSVLAIVVGLSVFLLVSALVEIAGLAFEAGEIYFVLSAVFMLYIARMAFIVGFERQTRKVIMMDFFSSRLYIYPETTDSSRR